MAKVVKDETELFPFIQSYEKPAVNKWKFRRKGKKETVHGIDKAR
jgi:hypothetical protein